MNRARLSTSRAMGPIAGIAEINQETICADKHQVPTNLQREKTMWGLLGRSTPMVYSILFATVASTSYFRTGRPLWDSPRPGNHLSDALYSEVYWCPEA